MKKTEEMQDLFKRRLVSEKAQKIILENDFSVLSEVFDYIHYEYYTEDIEDHQRELSDRDELSEKSVRKIAEILAYKGEEDSNLSHWDNIDLMIDKYGVSAKYEIKDETIEVDGHILYRIRALRDFGDVKKGEYGGFIEKEDNLSHEGTCWVGDNATVYGNARVSGDAKIYDDALVYNNAEVYGNAKIYGNAIVYGDAWVSDNALVYNNAEVYGNARVVGKANVTGEVSGGTIDGSEKKNIELE